MMTITEAQATNTVLQALIHPRAELTEEQRRQLVRDAATLADHAQRALGAGLSAKDVREAMER
ncbi:MAG: hypothetical protein CVT66_06175 [Actinobacteria bacterium HGW-Actinobacteria-6]|nr:MAG: hypothetical protein CVT66_06175 [Actinobacteria bacterium HGW-Actinobacteria-6]